MLVSQLPSRTKKFCGGISSFSAPIPQLAEGALGKRDVAGSTPARSSNSIMRLGNRERGNSIDTKV